MWVSACVSARVCLCMLCVLYVGYEKAGAAEFSTQEQGRKWCMDNSLFRSSGTCSEYSAESIPLKAFSCSRSHMESYISPYF